MIEVERVSKRHGSVTSVDNVSFVARSGEVTGLLGPNGAGKSSLMRIICDLDHADSGTVRVAGRRYRDHPEPVRVIGVQFEGSGAHPSRRAVDHLRWVAAAAGIPRSRVDEVLHLVDLPRAAWRRRVHTYSLGMHQRLGIATALLGNPEVLIFDEPANGLDPVGIRWLRGFLRGLADEGRTVLLSSHLMSETELVADGVVLMDRGRTIAEGTTTSLVSAYGSLEQAFFAHLAADCQRGDDARGTVR
ncbi:ABC-2 type transport system ATP-binding protein [Quadrisphaera granulorum]|uniref:ABC-2 type transport system ATP-binding protein n=1 Tax=Quadrisphaera granulorum TaxID=317664 RepID=A0A316A8D8_9ACTN|nr:ATP-binding cassette domain-containing protein [Quadrisphaera granulorum]PWJ53709.1 ABC-2 type transport system ATP-binding protein [Quadrisphaera granulorum]SZE96753.1 ABC-2 type transport system ATP-binding protein [Quadrisphaera granulorum]